MLDSYNDHVAQRKKQGVPPLPLSPEQTRALIDLVMSSPGSDVSESLEQLLVERVPPGVDPAAELKADFLYDVALGRKKTSLVSPERAVDLLGTMMGGYNVRYLISLLEDKQLGEVAANALKNTLLIYEAFDQVAALSKSNQYAQNVIESWANAEWFTRRPEVDQSLKVIAFKVEGEINTDDLSPASEAWSRPDIPLHARSMLCKRVDNALEELALMRKKNLPVAFVGDVVGTGSSRKSATNSVLWHIGDDIPFVPNKRAGGVCLGGKIAPIFFNTLEDAGALPVECDVSAIAHGDILEIRPYEGQILNVQTGQVICQFQLKTPVLLDEVRAGGRIPLIIGRSLTERARNFLGMDESDFFTKPLIPESGGNGYTLAQKIVGRACGIEGVRPGTYCEPVITSVGSQDTTGPMTRDELKELACLSFSADLVMQSFCHTAAYPKPVDVVMHQSLPDFITERGGVALRPGDGVIHSWLNRMILPDTVGTGGDSHTRFPIGISFPAGSGLVAFAATLGMMPLDMPESVLVRFSGKLQPGITLRDLVNAIPLKAIEMGLLTVAKAGKKNVFNGRILEIEGLPDLTVEQAFELTDAAAERSAAAATIKLDSKPVEAFLQSNIALLRWMIKEGYQDAATLERRIAAMQNWLEKPELLEADSDAEYAAVIEIDLSEVTEPIVCCPNDPDDVKRLSEVQNSPIDEVFIGSCMTNIGHYRAAARLLEDQRDLPTRLWVSPATRMDEKKLREEGYYGIFGKIKARMEMPGCSLCMGNQARVADNARVFSTSTRNFPNRVGDGADVFLGSAELAAICARLGRIPALDEYREYFQGIDSQADDIYTYLAFDKIEEYK